MFVSFLFLYALSFSQRVFNLYHTVYNLIYICLIFVALEMFLLELINVEVSVFRYHQNIYFLLLTDDYTCSRH